VAAGPMVLDTLPQRFRDVRCPIGALTRRHAKIPRRLRFTSRIGIGPWLSTQKPWHRFALMLAPADARPNATANPMLRRLRVTMAVRPPIPQTMGFDIPNVVVLGYVRHSRNRRSNP
jgi:hypothetical protein